jgi:hypothetical protein
MRRIRALLVSVVFVVFVTAAGAATTGCSSSPANPWLLRAEHHSVASVKAWAIDDYDRAAREAWKAERAARRAVEGRPVPRIL